ncbi:MAG: hypothetical protein ACRD9W_26845, partial [Terriglobia bacterium]
PLSIDFLVLSASAKPGCRVEMQKRRCRQRRSWCTYAWIGPLRLALAGATRSGTAGVEDLIAIHR